MSTDNDKNKNTAAIWAFLATVLAALITGAVALIIHFSPTPTPTPMSAPTQNPAQPVSNPAPTVSDSPDSPIEISAYCGQLGQSPAYARPDQEITFRWSWIARTSEFRQDYINAVSFSLQIDGKEVDISKASLTLSVDDNGDFLATWRILPMKLSAGTHDVIVTSTLSRQLTDGLDNDKDGKEDIYDPGVWTSPPCEVIVQ